MRVTDCLFAPVGEAVKILGEGIKTNRALVDQQRIAKVLLTASGVRFIANQQLYHTLLMCQAYD